MNNHGVPYPQFVSVPRDLIEEVQRGEADPIALVLMCIMNCEIAKGHANRFTKEEIEYLVKDVKWNEGAQP